MSDGIQGFSKPFKPQVIFSANKHPANHINMFLTYEKIPFEFCLGSYKGVLESSWQIALEDLNKVLPFMDGEESVLVLTSPNSLNQYSAELQFMDNSPNVDIGYFREVSQNEALRQDGWTRRLVHQAAPYESYMAYFVCYHNDIYGQPIKA
jgi:hypothetical protein